ncbi:hypothetical protein K502DRAFT_350103 [Neoconidiobolus thromboides FSU 785]|nr:hypothetical protein K502DRAFT_350103 [Neoconidiobolus thromboides FSU 785]
MSEYNKFNKCYLAINDINNSKTFDFFTSIMVTIVSILYLSVTVILVVVKLSMQAEKVQNFRLFRGVRASIEALNCVKIILLYIILMITSQSGLVIKQAAFDLVDITSPEFDILTYFTSGILGTFNFVVFFLNPSICSGFRKIYLKIITRNKFQDGVDDEGNSEATFSIKVNSNKLDQSNSCAFKNENVDATMLSKIIQTFQFQL